MIWDPNCIFCQIVADTTRCVLLAEEEAVLAFMDIHPANDGHCLVIPRGHFPTIWETPPDTFASVARLVVRVARAVQASLQPPGLSLVQANGGAANQTVPHLHIHVLPRRSNDGLLLNWPRTSPRDPGCLADVAERICHHLSRE